MATSWKSLRLQARDAEDLAILSAIVQDAVVSVADMGYVPEDHRFVMLANRFTWEAEANQRVLCGIRFEQVQRVQYRDFDLGRPDLALEILAIQSDTVDQTIILIHFAGGGCVRLETAGLACFIEDRAPPRMACGRPVHDLESGAADAAEGMCHGA